MYRLRFIAREIKTSRIEALSDGVFAIVMTLLVIELAVPEVPRLLAAEQLHLKLIEMWPKFAAYALSFIMLGMMWSFHRILIQYIRRVDERAVWINILYLMFIALVPFSTAMLGAYREFPITAVVFYGANLFLIALGYYILWWYVTKNKHFLNKDVSSVAITQIKINMGIIIILLLAAIGLSFISPYISIAIYILIVLLGIAGQLTSKPYDPGGKENK